MLNPQFHQLATDYINSLIRQRHYLIKAGLSKSNPGYINNSLAELYKYMRAYRYDTDQKMALFWVKHSSEIYALIPGIHSGSRRSTLLAYHALNGRARYLLESCTPWWRPLLRVSPN